MDENTNEVVNEEVAPAPVSETVAFEQSTGQAYSHEEQELIQKLTQSRLEHKDALEYIDLKDYEVPPPAHFYQLSKPCVSIKYPHMTFSMSSVKLFDGVYHVLPIIAKTRPRIAVIPLAEEELASFQWARLKEDKCVNKTISAPGFLDNVFHRMNWSKKMRYKAYGHVANSHRGLVLAFDLEQATWIPGTFSEYLDKETGEIKKKRDVYLPSQYKNQVGMDFEEYVSGHQMNLFTDFPDMMNMTYEDVPTEYLEETEVPIEAQKE